MACERITVALILLLGCGIRTVHLAYLPVDFPNKGGGLYVEFAQQIADAGFKLPSTIPFYTDGGIPFAYPPLPFYVEGLLMRVFSLSSFAVANLLPLSVAILTLFAFNELTKVFGLKYPTRAMALLAYATMDSAFLEQISPAGLAEAFGSLSLVALAIVMFKACRRDTIGSYALIGLSWAVAIVSSPGSAYASIVMFLIFSVVQLTRSGKILSGQTMSFLILCGSIAVAVSSPYWLTVIEYHGIRIFTSSFGAQHNQLLSWENLEKITEFQLAGDSFVWNIMLISGVVWAIVEHRWALIFWLFASYSIPREGGWLLATPAALLIGHGGIKMIALPLLNFVDRLDRKVETAILVVLLVPMIIGPAVIGIVKRVRNSFIPAEAVTIMKWVEANTLPESKFLVLVSNPVLEWAPHIMQRSVLNVKYGTEFVVDEREDINRLNNMLYDCDNFDCVYDSLFSSEAVAKSQREWYSKNGVYLLASKNNLTRFRESSNEVAFASIQDEGAMTLGLLMPLGFDLLLELDTHCGVMDARTIPARLSQGEVLNLDLRWVCRRSPTDGLQVRISLVDDSGTAQQSITTEVFEGGVSGKGWSGIIEPRQHVVQVSPHLPPGQYALEVKRVGSHESRTLTHFNVEPLPRVFEYPTQMAHALEAQFGADIQLLGYDLVREDGGGELTLHWRAVQRPEGYYKVFVHVVDPETGAVVAQHDAVPRNWTYPTNWWEAGEVVSDEIVIPMADVPSGKYKVVIGMYDPESGGRLRIYDAIGDLSPQDHLVLPDRIMW